MTGMLKKGEGGAPLVLGFGPGLLVVVRGLEKSGYKTLLPIFLKVMQIR